MTIWNALKTSSPALITPLILVVFFPTFSSSAFRDAGHLPLRSILLSLQNSYAASYIFSLHVSLPVSKFHNTLHYFISLFPCGPHKNTAVTKIQEKQFLFLKTCKGMKLLGIHAWRGDLDAAHHTHIHTYTHAFRDREKWYSTWKKGLRSQLLTKCLCTWKTLHIIALHSCKTCTSILEWMWRKGLRKQTQQMEVM